MSDDYWEKAYESGEYQHWEFEYPSPELTLLVAAQLLGAKARVLDVGSGGGIDAIFLARQGFSVTGVDISIAALNIANKRTKKAKTSVSWVRASFSKLPFQDDSFDLITDRGLFHLVEDKSRPKYASEAFRILKENGRILIRGKSSKSSNDQFNPITKAAIDKFFSKSKFKRGPVLQIPLFSIEGHIDAKIVMLQKRMKK